MHHGCGMEQPNRDKIRTLGEKETYKYLEKLEDDTIKQEEKKIEKEYFRRTRKRQNYIAKTLSSQ